MTAQRQLHETVRLRKSKHEIWTWKKNWSQMYIFSKLIFCDSVILLHIPGILYMQCVTQMKETHGETNNSFRQKTQRGMGRVQERSLSCLSFIGLQYFIFSVKIFQHRKSLYHSSAFLFAYCVSLYQRLGKKTGPNFIFRTNRSSQV